MAYDHLALEARWQAFWEKNRTFRSERRPGHPKYYVLDMFPYPSGNGLHVGHPEGYTATDIVARYKRMRGFDVMHPMGWDAFGLPAEQYAIQTGTPPATTTKKNVDRFRAQLKRLGFAYDWEREIATTDADYVRWTQWIFLRLFERGLAFQAEIPVNWCPALGTVLANEEIIDGRSERGNFPVVRQPLRQWQLRITAYADRLAQDLESLDWPETRQKQRDWIGRSEGAEVDFALVGRGEKLRCFTTRPDTLFGATYMVVAPDHPLTLQIATEEKKAEVSAYAAAAARKSDLERTALTKQKTGIFTGAYAVNPLTQRPIPVFTADYVLGAYGTGAIMAVPGHDERDFEFAKQFDLPIIEVVSPDQKVHGTLTKAFTEDGYAVNSDQFDGMPTAQVKLEIIAHLERLGIGERKVNYKLRDWVFSRQRYWGEPIPIYFPVRTAGDPRQGAEYEIDDSRPIAVDDCDLPLQLPEMEDYRPGNDPRGPLAKALEWRFFKKNGEWYARETNTMPQWAGSCWYYLRFLDPQNRERLIGEQAYEDWMPVDMYVGGSEHAVLHLLYARFWHKVLFDIGVVRDKEPFIKLVHQGLVLGMVYRWYAVLGADGKSVERALDGDDSRVVKSEIDGLLRTSDTNELIETCWLNEDEVTIRDGVPTHQTYGVRVVAVAEKMSKSRGNVVNPDTVIDEFGADSLRLYEMFMGPLEQAKPWQTSGIQGVRRFLERVYALGTRELSAEPMDAKTARIVHRTIKKVGEDIEELRFNTAISAMMILSNHLASLDSPPKTAVQSLVQCLAPFAPHLAEELWRTFGYEQSVADADWPQYDSALCEDDEIEMAIQVNGRVRARITIAKQAPREIAETAALDDADVQRFIGGRPVQKIVYVPGKIINIILG